MTRVSFRSRGLQLAFVAASLVADLPAAARDEESGPAVKQGQPLLEQAIASFERGEFERARSLLLQAKDQLAEPRRRAKVYLYLGLIAAAGEQRDEAQRHFRQALSLDPSLVLDPYRFKPSVVQLFARARSSVLGSVSIRADRPGLSVWLDGKMRGKLPYREGDVPAGTHRLQLRTSDGSTAYDARLEVQPGVETAIYAVTLVDRRRGAADTGQPQSHPPSRPHRRYLWSWVGVGITAAAGAVTLGFGVSTLVNRDRGCTLIESSAGGSCAASEQVRIAAADYERYRDLKARVDRDRLLTNIFFGVTGAMAALTVALFVVEHRAARQNEHRRAASIAARARLVPTQGGVLAIGELPLQ